MADLRRIEDPDGRPLQPGWVRIDFATEPLMAAAGIESSMTEEAHARYLELLRAYISTIDGPITFEATGYRYGPAAAGDEAFVEFALRGIEVVQAVFAIGGLVAWLREMGAGDVRVSKAGIEALGQAELERRGYAVAGDPISIGLMPGKGETPWGTPRPHGGYVAVFRLRDGRLAVLEYTLDGIVTDLSIATGDEPPSNQLPPAQDISRRAGALDETPFVDHALTAALAGLQAVPVIGGMIATFVDEYVPRQRQRRLVSFVQDLSARLVAESDRIDHEFVRTEDLGRLLEDVLDAVQQRRNEDKQAYYASALTNSLTSKRPRAADREKMLDVLNELRLSHLRMIAVYMTIEIPDSILPLQGDMEHRIVHGSLPELTHEEVDADILELQTRGVLPLLTPIAKEGDPHRLSSQMTPFGRRFARWVEATTFDHDLDREHTRRA